MYFSAAAILASAAICGLPVYATPLPFAASESSTTEDLSAVVKRQSADRICGGNPGSSFSHQSKQNLTLALTDRNAYSSSHQAKVFQAAQSYDLAGTGGVLGSNGEFHQIAYYCCALSEARSFINIIPFLPPR